MRCGFLATHGCLRDAKSGGCRELADLQSGIKRRYRGYRVSMIIRRLWRQRIAIAAVCAVATVGTAIPGAVADDNVTTLDESATGEPPRSLDGSPTSRQ